jgi:hypothetical protein
VLYLSKWTPANGRYPEMRLALPAEELRWGGNFLRGFTRLPVVF